MLPFFVALPAPMYYPFGLKEYVYFSYTQIGSNGVSMKDGSLRNISSTMSLGSVRNLQCRYGLFDRHGGVSRAPFASLNIGLAVGDSVEAVATNRRLVKGQMGVEWLLSARQIHGEEVYLLEQTPDRDVEVEGYDALITNQPHVGLVVQHADCQAVLLYDPVKQAIGAVHSGWRGSVLNLIGKTVQAMTGAFGTDPTTLRVVISPSLGPCCAEFVNYELELPVSFQEFMNAHSRFNFWEISKRQLLDCGVVEQAILLPTICTSCSADYFSYRRACREGDSVTGRNCSVIALIPE
jgi:YfiH family protein